jgi:hypothetical protein
VHAIRQDERAGDVIINFMLFLGWGGHTCELPTLSGRLPLSAAVFSKIFLKIRGIFTN